MDVFETPKTHRQNLHTFFKFCSWLSIVNDGCYPAKRSRATECALVSKQSSVPGQDFNEGIFKHEEHFKTILVSGGLSVRTNND